MIFSRRKCHVPALGGNWTQEAGRGADDNIWLWFWEMAVKYENWRRDTERVPAWEQQTWKILLQFRAINKSESKFTTFLICPLCRSHCFIVMLLSWTFCLLWHPRIREVSSLRAPLNVLLENKKNLTPQQTCQERTEHQNSEEAKRS